MPESVSRRSSVVAMPSNYAKAVQVVVKLFAALRERAGTAERRLDLDAGSTAGDVWSALELGDEPAGLLYAVNREYAERDRPLADGDEVALIPPVSGGTFRLSETPLDLAAAVAEPHRVGRVGIGEQSVVIAVSAPHRHDALAACRDAIDTLKETVPLWKKEVYEGGEEWIGRGSSRRRASSVVADDPVVRGRGRIDRERGDV